MTQPSCWGIQGFVVGRRSGCLSQEEADLGLYGDVCEDIHCFSGRWKQSGVPHWENGEVLAVPGNFIQQFNKTWYVCCNIKRTCNHNAEWNSEKGNEVYGAKQFVYLETSAYKAIIVLQKINRYVHAYQIRASHGSMVHHDLRILIQDLTLNFTKEVREGGRQEGIRVERDSRPFCWTSCCVRRLEGWSSKRVVQGLTLWGWPLGSSLLKEWLKGGIQGRSIHRRVQPEGERGEVVEQSLEILLN